MGQKISIRKYPYPYRAAFSFCNDCDLMTPERYIFLKDLFINFPQSSQRAAKGLPYQESFFVFNQNPYHPDQLCFETHTDLLSSDIEQGYTSILHSWGDFNFNPSFKKADAIRGFQLLNKLKRKPIIWVNHGTPHNLQNIGHTQGFGDLPGYTDGSGRYYDLSEYHLDITRNLGIEYYWLGELTQTVPQEIKTSYKMAKETVKTQINNKVSGTWLENKIRKTYQTLRIIKQSNTLIRKITLRDKTEAFNFIRYGTHAYATADNLSHLLSPNIINRLISNNGAMIFYTHLAKTSGPVNRISQESMAVLKHLKKLFDEKFIWVTKVEKLLDYSRVRDNIVYEVNGNRVQINSIGQVNKFRSITALQLLNGLCFYCNKPAKTEVYFGDKQLEFTTNPSDHNGNSSITLR